MNTQKLLSGWLYFAAVLFIVTGCTPHRPRTNPILDIKAVVLAHQARAFNQHILSSKGTGWAKLETKTTVDKFRIAWAAAFPNKIRITFLMSGLPIETIIATGEKITFFSHTGEHSKYSYDSNDPNMEKFIKVPVKMSEMVSILLGRFPVKNFDDAYFSPQDPSSSTITLRRNFKGVSQSVQFDSNKKIDRLNAMDTAGKLLYEITIFKYKAYDSDDIPIKIEIKDMDNKKLTLDITSFQSNPVIKETVFQLTEPGS
ncbi:MAG: DUF4292 domain-containing protein [Proteobacteria bacterium]|nr:DUF4292 domain-containing protein [Pseudomonadota bacterium]MBU1584177.1 DUF4292 domain-containing protein [Pseudomonadota bacterium]MBU2627414.1 DUF4292 domain-containing protein [Pseudomonadota bacterium]